MNIHSAIPSQRAVMDLIGNVANCIAACLPAPPRRVGCVSIQRCGVGQLTTACERQLARGFAKDLSTCATERIRLKHYECKLNYELYQDQL